MELPESPLSAAPTAPSSPSIEGFRLEDSYCRVDKVEKIQAREQNQEQAQEQKQEQNQEQAQEEEEKTELDYFEEARKAQDEVEDEEDEKPLPNDGVCATIFLRNGDIHRCRGVCCPLLELQGDRLYFCPISHLVFDNVSVREDLSTGRITGSANPDDTAGATTHAVKADAFELSSRAFDAGEEEQAVIEESSVFVAQKKKRRRKGEAEPKRGARCVNDNSGEAEHKAKATRRSAATSEQYALLVREAEVVMSQLVAHVKREEVETKNSDPRLCDHSFLLAAATQKYIKSQQSAGQAPCLSDLHDLSIAAARIASANRAKQQADKERSGRQSLLLKPAVRQKVVALAVTLWLTSCETKYMLEDARNTESFRPFVSGVLYALKRGVALESGANVVPSCPVLCEALPVLRATQAKSHAKSLHASSHCGLRILHRSIASCAREEADERYAACVTQAAALAADVAAGKFDLQ